MDPRNTRVRAAAPAQTPIDHDQLVPSGEPQGHDYSPKKMTPQETIVFILKICTVACGVMGLLWLAAVKLDK